MGLVGERGKIPSEPRQAAVTDQVAWVAYVGVNVGKRERLDPLRLFPQAFSRGSGMQNLDE
jgi:hypothetical protein